MENRTQPQSNEGPDRSPQANLRSELEQIQLIATGGMSYVFRAFQPSLGRYLVVKRLKDDLFKNPETVERFRREARALASVLHQNIAHVYDFVEAPGEAFILMEHIEGIDLSTVIEKLGNLPPVIAAAISLGVAKGLQHIHANGLIHRDIKPSNIRLTARGGVKLMDFGIVLELSNTSLTRPGIMVGSPSYLSPEQVLGDIITAQSDIFLVGITLYEMLTGTRPFKAEGGNTVFQKIREASFTSVRAMNSKVPAVLDRMASKCLKQDPSARFDGVRGLVSELEKFLGPEISSRPEDVILKFLDQEALLKIDVPLHELPTSKKGAPDWIPWAVLALVPLVLWLFYSLGYRAGQNGHVQLQQSPVQTSAGKVKIKDRKPAGQSAR